MSKVAGPGEAFGRNAERHSTPTSARRRWGTGCRESWLQVVGEPPTTDFAPHCPRKGQHAYPGGPYVLLHTLAHLLIQSLAMRCGYPASSLRERIYAESGRYGILVYTGTPDAEGTLGGLVQQGRHIEDHLAEALRMGQLCSNEPICAQHAPAESMRNAYLHGAACHGCTLIAETSCEMRNDFLDRALVVPVLGLDDAAFFPGPL